MRTPITLFHCSMLDHGEDMTVRRLTPLQPDKKEPSVPRLCVAPTVVQCFAARLMHSHDVHVYATLRPTKGIQPKGVWDELVTDERWLIPNHRLHRVDTIPRRIADDISLDILRWHERTKKAADYRIRVAALWRACTAIPEHASKRISRLANVWCESLGIDPIAMFTTENQ